MSQSSIKKEVSNFTPVFTKFMTNPQLPLWLPQLAWQWQPQFNGLRPKRAVTHG